MAHRFRDLEIWKLSRILCSDIYKITSKFPDTEKFSLTNQLKRASVSVPSNIAEGSSRMSNKDFSRFLEIAIGSMYEIQTQLLIALDLTYITEDEQQTLNNSLDAIVKMTSSFRSTLK